MRNVLVAVLGGLVVAVILWAAGGAPRAARAVAGSGAGPDATDVAAATTGRQAPAFRARPGTTRIVARARDVAGGPDWVVERFVLRGRPFAPHVRVPPGPVECVRLGRSVAGRVTWLDALGRRGSVARIRQPTFCTVDGRARDLQTLAILDARGGLVRRSALVTFGFGVGVRGDRRAMVHGRRVTLPAAADAYLRVDRPVPGETPVNARARRRDPAFGPPPASLPARLRRRLARDQALNHTSAFTHPRVISQSGTPIGTVGVVVARMPSGAPCVASGVNEVFLGTIGMLRGSLGIVEVASLYDCRRLAETAPRDLPSAGVGFVRSRDAAGRPATFSTALVQAPPGVDRVELRTVAGVQTVRVAAPGVAVAVWPDTGAGSDDFGAPVDVVGLRPDGRRVVARRRYVEPGPPTGDVAFGG